MINLDGIIKKCLSKIFDEISYDVDFQGENKTCGCIPKIENFNPYKKFINMELTKFSFDIYFVNEDFDGVECFTVLDSISEKSFNEENIEQLIDEYLAMLMSV